jgi:antitoxin CcdA
MNYGYDTNAPKKSVNLSANSDLLRMAKEEDVNLSRTLEEAVAEKLRQKLEHRWREENKDAIAAYNARIEKNGVFGAKKRRF